MFADANVKDRSRYLVRGRVLVFTDSRFVEFLEENLKYSYPLYSQPNGYPAGFGLAFMVEVNGYLTFDADSHYRVTQLSCYTTGYYDPAGFAIVAPADSSTFRVTGYEDARLSPSLTAYDQVGVFHDSPVGPGNGYALFTCITPIPVADFQTEMDKYFKVGSIWKGGSQYPNFKLEYDHN